MRPNTENHRVRLALSSGEIFEGQGFGAILQGAKSDLGTGEVVFNTAMCGYEESLTDPSYMGQILVQTASMIGNTGMNDRDMESSKIQVSGMVVHEYVDSHSNYRATASLDARLKQAGVPGIAGVDTRELTTLLRSQGVVQGIISGDSTLSDAELVTKAKQVQSMEGKDLASTAGVREVSGWSESSESWNHIESQYASDSSEARLPVGVIDCGIKGNILRCLTDAGCDPVILPMDTNAESIKVMHQEGKIHGLFLSNGPGDPGTLTGLIQTVRLLVHDPDLNRFPIFGICLGHQILALAHGAKTIKLKFGHRGINHPVLAVDGGGVSITSQNHGFAVDAESCESIGLRVTHWHLNDQTVAGIDHPDRPIAGVQHHPEASPGPHDASDFFTRFTHKVREMSGAAIR